MLEFNNSVNKVKLNSFEATKKAKKEENKPQEKTAEASSAEALNSYGRAFVNLSFKGKVENSQAETLSEKEQEAILKEIEEYYRQEQGFSDLDIKCLMEDITSGGKDVTNKVLYAYKKLKEDGAQTMEAIALAILHASDKDNAEAKINFAKQLEKQGYNLLSIATLLYVDAGEKPSKAENLDKELVLVKKLLDDDTFEDEEKSAILSQARQCKIYDKSIIEFAKEVKNSIPDSQLFFYDLLKNLCSSNKQIQEKQLAFAKELAQNKSYSGLDISLLLGTKTDDEQTTDQLISFVKELIKDGDYNSNNISGILGYIKADNKQVTQQQLAFAKELIKDKNNSVGDIMEILAQTKTNNEQATQQLISLAKELISNKRYGIYGATETISKIKTDDKQLTQQLASLVKELIKDKNWGSFDIIPILVAINTKNKQSTQQQIAFAKELIEDKNYKVDDIQKILSGTQTNNEKITQQQITFAKELIQNKSYDTCNIKEILFGTKADDEQVNQQLISFAKELMQDKDYSTYHINNILSGVTSSDSKTTLSKIENAKKILAKADENEGLTKNQAIAILTSENKVSYKDVKKLQRKIGQKNAANLTISDTAIACKLIDMCQINDINQIPLEKKKELIRNLVECSNGCFKIPDSLRQFFPLIPATQEEYCSLLPALVKAVGIETKELKEDEIKEFNSSLDSLGNALEKISDKDFGNLQITQEYPKEDFIKDTFNIVKDLPENERQKVYDYFGFELHKNPNGAKVNDKLNFSIVGYPANLNNGKKLAKIEDTKTKEIVEKLRPYVIKYSENNKISTNNDNVTNAINSIIKYLPEFRIAIDKTQHGAHDYAIANHSLKVMQKIVQNPEFKNLNNSDKKLMLLSALLHDLSKTEGKKDVLHATNSAFDAYYISKKFNLTRDEEIKLYSLIKNHEWLGYVNAKDLTTTEKLQRQQSVAFDLQYDNLFDMSKIFTKADLESVKKDDEFYDKFKSEFEANSSKIDSLISELKTSQPLFPVTKIPSASRINKAITTVNPDGSTNLKGIYKDENGLVIIRFNEVENSTWEKIGFDKGSISKGITTTTSVGDEVDTGNIHFFVHGLDYENQLSKFDAFSLPDSDALLSVSYVERPESKTRFFRSQGVILDTETKYTYGGGETDSGSGCGKNIDNFKKDYVFGGNREADRKYISNLIKTTLELDDKEYLDFVQKNKNKSFGEIEPAEVREKLIKAFAGINSNTRRGNRAYNEMYISNPNVMGVFAYPTNPYDAIGDTMNFVKVQDGFLRKYAIEHDVPMIVFGK